MKKTKIIINDIFGSMNISINTPIIILSCIPSDYLQSVDHNVYNVNTKRLYNELQKQYEFIEQFIPVGQIYDSYKKKEHTMLMANSKFVHITNSFEELTPNIWIGIVRS